MAAVAGTTLALLSLCAIVRGLQFSGHGRSGNNIDKNVNLHDINKRSEKGADIYSHLAALSGGSVIGSNKTDIGDASSITVAEASLASPVVVMVTHVNATTPRDVTFSVDAALTLILVEVTGHVTKSAIQLSDPAGVAVDTLVVDSAGAIVYKAVAPSPGNWKLHLSDKLQCDVIVKGSSDVSFQSQFMKVNPVTGYDISVPGNPPAGKNLTLAITVNGADKTRNITRVTLYTLNGDVIKSAVLTHVGRRGALYKATISLPSQTLRIGVRGEDSHGSPLTRVSSRAVIPEAELSVTFHDTEGIIYPGRALTLPYTVVNNGEPGNFTITVTSESTTLHASTSPAAFSINRNASYTSNVTVTTTASTETAGNIRVTVTGPSGFSQFNTVLVSTAPVSTAPSTKPDPGSGGTVGAPVVFVVMVTAVLAITSIG